jgi:RND family efflux transporter MFP subunit
MKMSRKIVIAASMAVLLVATGCGGDHSTPPAEEMLPVQVTLATAERVEMPAQRPLRGTVIAARTATVSTRVMAEVMAVHVQMGHVVRRGQLLIEIDPQATQGQVAQARGALGQARAALVLAEKNHERFKALAAKNAASELELDQARMQYEAALGAVEQAEGAVAAASAVAGDSEIEAPFDGRVARRMVEVGDLAAPGRPLMVIESEGERRFAVSVPESLMGGSGLSVGSVVEVELSSPGDSGRVEAEVAKMSPGADPASHSFELELVLPQRDLSTGTTGRAWIPGAERSLVVIPEHAVIRRGGSAMVVVRDAEGRASSRVVTLGEALPEACVEVLSGLAGGETIAVGLKSVPPLGTPIDGAGV